jgi:oxalate---CoA ligase
MNSVLAQLIQAQAARCPEAPALLAPGREPLRYGELHAAVADIARTLTRLGVKSSDRVALVCSNGPEMAMAFLGIAGHAACAPLNPAYRASELEFYLADLCPRAVVVQAGLDSAVRSVASAQGIPILELTPRLSGPAGGFDLAGAAGPAVQDARGPQLDGIALLLHTSGTTSRPKLVPLTQANLCASARNIADSLQLSETDRCLNVMPLFHIHGLGAAVLASIASGGSVVCSAGFVAPKFFEWVREFRPSWYTAVPSMHQAILARAAASREVIERNPFRFIRSCSSALAPSLMQEMESVFQVPVVEAYGMTEAAHQMASNPLPPGQRKPGSVGMAAGPEIAIMDEAGCLLPVGVSGEIVIRGTNVTRGYADNPEANARSFTNGWFRTGDQGHIDTDGFLFLTGRLKEIINRGGEKIAPREIDEALLCHPAVAQAVAFAAPHAALGETVAAAVVLRSGLVASERELREFAAQRLADFKVPQKVLFLDEIPKGPTGKIQRIGLASRLGVDEIKRQTLAGQDYVAPRTDAEKAVAAVFAGILGVERVGIRDSFFERGGDSLLAAMLLVDIRQTLGAEISLLTLLENPSVAGVCENLESSQSGARPESGTSDLRVIIRDGHSRPPLFCVPGSHGNLAGFFHLARRLGKEYPVTAFRPGPRGNYRIEDLAARYVAEVLDVQPEGPYHLVGACVGGLVAYEMACQIRAKGEPVALLALLDCYNHAWAGRSRLLVKAAYRFGLLQKRFSYNARNLRDAGLTGAAGYLRPRFAAFLKTTRERCVERVHRLAVRAGLRLRGRLSDPRLVIRHAAAHYVPPQWPGRLELFRVQEPRVDAYDYPELGWQGKAAGGVGIHDVPGSHLAMLAEPNVQFVVEGLLGCLEKADAVR